MDERMRGAWVEVWHEEGPVGPLHPFCEYSVTISWEFKVGHVPVARQQGVNDCIGSIQVHLELT